MAHLRSSDDIMNEPGKHSHFNKGHKFCNPLASRIKSAVWDHDVDKLRPKQVPQKKEKRTCIPNPRCITPTSFQSSEAHIHRIRSATGHAEFKHKCKFATSMINLPKHSGFCEPTCQESKAVSSDPEEQDDVESVDWTAPIDITAYLYKPEYIIPSKNTNQGTCLVAPIEQDANGYSNEAVEMPINKNCTKAEIVDEYIKSSVQKDGQRPTYFDRRVQNCFEFAKNIQNDLKQMTRETKRIDMLSSRPKRNEPREELLERGYAALKRIYELNPELTESAAMKHIKGSPGNHWMGLSRVEILETMQRIRSELGVPPNENFEHNKFKLKKKPKSTKAKSQNKDKKVTLKAPKTTKQKPVNLMPHHVPGPKHLHTNICIRPWEETLDGWNPNDYENYNSNGLATATNRPVSPQSEEELGKKSTLSCNTTPPSTAYHPANDNEWPGEEDFITLEIFNPVFRIYR